MQGIWGKTVTDDNNAGNGNKYWVLDEHIMFNLSNLLMGYNEDRVWNVVPFVGGGIGRTMTHNLYAMNLSAGIQSTWKVSKLLNIYLEGGWNRFEGDIDGNELVTRTNRGWDCHDNNLYAEVGLIFNLGKATWNKVPDVDALKAQYQNCLLYTSPSPRDS